MEMDMLMDMDTEMAVDDGMQDNTMYGEAQTFEPPRRPWTDAYGFVADLTAEEEVEYEKVRAQLQKSEATWKILAKSGHDKEWYFNKLTSMYANPNPVLLSTLVVTSPASKKLRALVRAEGIPPNHRRDVWSNLSGAAYLKSQYPPNYYAELRETPCDPDDLDQIEKDLHRTFMYHPWFHTDEGLLCLRNVLSAYAVRNPEVGYAQSMNYIAGMLLLVTHADEEAAFWLLATLIEQILPSKMFSRELGFQKDLFYKFSKMMYSTCPGLQMHLIANVGYDLQILLYMWVYTLFARESFPAETTLRVWDLLFTDFGSPADILLLVPLAIYQINEQELLEAYDEEEVHQVLVQSALRLTDANLLIELVSERLQTTKLRTPHPRTQV